jgi:nucleoside-triphosphatase THEP1
VAVIRTTLVALKQGKNVKYIGLDLYKRGESEKITEIDVLTEDEMVEVKTGDYSLETKLSGRDMNQFTNLKRFFEQKIVVVDENGKLINAPRKFVYQFTKPISKELDSWLKQKGVTEVRSPR